MVGFQEDKPIFSQAEMISQKLAIYPVHVINSKNKIVDFCITRAEAMSRIKKRNQALVLLGREPQKYRIVSKNMKSEIENPIKMKNQTEIVEEIYLKFKKHFPNTFFHNLLWQLLINKTRSLKDAAFIPVIVSGYQTLGIADKNVSGYSPTGVVFETHNYDEASKICEELNKEVFGIGSEEAFEITSSSFRKS